MVSAGGEGGLRSVAWGYGLPTTIRPHYPGFPTWSFTHALLLSFFVTLGCIIDSTAVCPICPISPKLKLSITKSAHQSFSRNRFPVSILSKLRDIVFLASCANRLTSFILTCGESLHSVKTPSDTFSTADSCLSPSVFVIRMLPGLSKAGICAEKSREGTPDSQLKGTYFRGKRTAGVIL